MANYKKSEEWLHKPAGWKTQGIRTGEKFYPKYNMQFWKEDKEMVFCHITKGKTFRGMKAEVCAEVDAYMHSNGYYK